MDLINNGGRGKRNDNPCWWKICSPRKNKRLRHHLDEWSKTPSRISAKPVIKKGKDKEIVENEQTEKEIRNERQKAELRELMHLFSRVY